MGIETEMTAGEESLPPTFKNYKRSGVAEDGYVNAQERTSTDPLFTKEDFPGVTVKYSPWVEKTVGCSETTQFTSGNLPGASALPATDGQYYVCIRLSDDARGSSSIGRSPLITLDTTKPLIEDIQPLTVGKKTTLSPAVEEITESTFAWSMENGPGEMTFTPDNQRETTFKANKVGLYQIKLKVTDAALNESSITVDVVWDHRVPSFVKFTSIGVAEDGLVHAGEAGVAGPLFELEAADYESISFTGLIPEASHTCTEEKSYTRTTIPAATDLLAEGGFGVCVQLTNKIA